MSGVDYCYRCGEKIKQEIQERQRKEEAEKRIVEVKKDTLGAMVKAGVSPCYAECSFDTFEVTNSNKKYLKFCQKYVEGPQDSLFLTGRCGSGKTHLAVSIAKELLLQGNVVRFVSVPELLLKIRQTFDRDAGMTDIDYIEMYGQYQYLVLDDFGAEKTTEWARTTLYLIIDKRIRLMKPTIVTSNLSLEQIEDVVDGRLASRLAGFKVVNFQCEDWRKRR